MYTKELIYNLALSDLLLSRTIKNVETDTSNEGKTLNLHYPIALRAALEDMDLDATADQVNLELIEEDPNDLWDFSYKYPSNCAKLRRLQSSVRMDDRDSHIEKRVATRAGKKVIFTDEASAIAEFIPHDINLSILSAQAGLTIAHKLALLSAALITGKGARELMKQIQEKYVVSKAEAQEHDHGENFNFVDPETESEFVKARTS